MKHDIKQKHFITRKVNDSYQHYKGMCTNNGHRMKIINTVFLYYGGKRKLIDRLKAIKSSVTYKTMVNSRAQKMRIAEENLFRSIFFRIIQNGRFKSQILFTLSPPHPQMRINSSEC